MCIVFNLKIKKKKIIIVNIELIASQSPFHSYIIACAMCVWIIFWKSIVILQTDLFQFERIKLYCVHSYKHKHKHKHRDRRTVCTSHPHSLMWIQCNMQEYWTIITPFFPLNAISSSLPLSLTLTSFDFDICHINMNYVARNHE